MRSAWTHSALAPLHLVDAELAGSAITLVHAFGDFGLDLNSGLRPNIPSSIWNALLVGRRDTDWNRCRRTPPRARRNASLRHGYHRPSSAPGDGADPSAQFHQGLLSRPGDRRANPLPGDRASYFADSSALDGAVPSAPVELHTEENPSTAIGQLTSVAEVIVPEFQGTWLSGPFATEVLERKSTIVYDGGTVTVLDHSPVPPWQ